MRRSFCHILPPDSVKCSVSPCVMALRSFFKLFVISGKKNDSGSQERRGVERVREVYFPLLVIFRLNCSQGWNSLYCTPLWWRKEERHFLYTWPMDTINKQAALTHVHLRRQTCLRCMWQNSERWVKSFSCCERWNKLKEEPLYKEPIDVLYPTYSREQYSCLCQVLIQFWWEFKEKLYLFVVYRSWSLPLAFCSDIHDFIWTYTAHTQIRRALVYVHVVSRYDTCVYKKNSLSAQSVSGCQYHHRNANITSYMFSTCPYA